MRKCCGACCVKSCTRRNYRDEHLTNKGQMTLPKAAREALHLKPGQRLQWMGSPIRLNRYRLPPWFFPARVRTMARASVNSWIL
jgi:antidote-toxin recognition MazE-like antitoxin